MTGGPRRVCACVRGFGWLVGVVGDSGGGACHYTQLLTTRKTNTKTVHLALMQDDPTQGIVRATNGVRERVFRGAKELGTDVWERRTIHILLCGGYVRALLVLVLVWPVCVCRQG